MFTAENSATGWHVVTTFMRNIVGGLTFRAGRVDAQEPMTEAEAKAAAAALNRWYDSQTKRRK